MKKLGALFRETLEGDIKNKLKESTGIFIIKYSKLSSPDMTTLRHVLKGSSATLFVAKNSIARRALKDSKYQDLVKFVEGPCGLVFTPGEPFETTRSLYNFYREHEQLKVECGFFEDKIFDPKDIEYMAKLPGKDALRAQVVMTLNSPITGLVYALKQTLTKFVYCLGQIKNKKGSASLSDK